MPSDVVLLLGVGALVLLATVIVTLAVVLKNPVVIQVPSRRTSGTPASAPEPTMQTQPGSLKMLPGTFVVEEDGAVQELRIFQTNESGRVETTLGRESGSPLRHIQLRDPTVSAKHAKLVYEGGSYSLTNYSHTNPVRVNGEELPEGAARRLVDGDRIELGEVVVTYRS